MNFFSVFSKDIGIDLGTVNTLIYIQNKGIVLNEPSVVALSKSNNEIISVGKEAKKMLGRTPGSIVAINPMRDGVIADFEIVEKMIRYFIGKIIRKRSLIKPRVIIGVPTGTTEVERRAVQESCEQAGARDIFLIEEPVAAAIGAGLPVSEPIGNMIVDIGGGTTEIAIISLGSIVVENSIRVGGNQIDLDIMNFMKKKHNLEIGVRTAENLKTEFVDLWNLKSNETYYIKGRDCITGLPRTLSANKAEIKQAISESLEKILNAVKTALDKTPAELAADIIENGIVLSGGGALLKGIKNYISTQIGVPVIIANEPTLCVVKGTGIYLEELKKIKNKKVLK